MTSRVFSPALLLIALLLGAGSAYPQTTVRVSVTSTGSQAYGESWGPSISADGRFVAFSSDAWNLVPNDTNMADVFVHDRETGETILVDVSSDGIQANRDSTSPSISADGRLIAFWSQATNLVPNDTNGSPDIFVHDLRTGVTVRASVSSAGGQAEGGGFPGSSNPVISASGRYVAFGSLANNLVPSDINRAADIFVRDLRASQTRLVSVDSAGNQTRLGAWSGDPSISATGRYIAFWSAAPNLVPSDSNDSTDAFVHDLRTGETTCVTVDAAGQPTGGGIPSISGGGRFVAALHYGVMVYDRLARTATRADVDSEGNPANGVSLDPVISADGRFVAFLSQASNLVPDDTNLCSNDEVYNCDDVFIHDLLTRVTTRESVSWDGAQLNHESYGPSLSADGRFATFSTVDDGVVPGDIGHQDVFVRDRAPCRAGTVNATSGQPSAVLFANGSSGSVTIERNASLRIRLDASPAGPSPARYLLWVWAAPPSNQLGLTVGRSTLGCTANPTPATPNQRPHPILCLRSPSLPARVCRGIAESPQAPAFAPFTLGTSAVHRGGFATLQGVIEDLGAGNTRGFSVTNAVVVESR